MDFDFTDDEGDGVTVEYDPAYGILVSAADADSYTGAWADPDTARAIATALEEAANHAEGQ